MAKPKITRIKAGESGKVATAKKPKKAADKPAKVEKNEKVTKVAKPAKVAEKAEKPAKISEEKGAKKPFILARPFVYLGRYLRDSWREIRQVRWPNRKATWKMVIAVLVYTALFVVIISLLDMFFTWLFSLIIK